MNDQKTENKREPYVIKVDQHQPFDAIAQTKYITSNELCRLTSELFRGVFEDYEGCIFETNNGEASMTLVFNHGKYDENATVACRLGNAQSSGNSVIDRTRTRDYIVRDGNKYLLTEDGKDAITPLLVPRIWNNGNPNWSRIVSDWVDRNMMNAFSIQQLPQYTKVSYIDLRQLCRLIFGSTDGDDNVDYSVLIMSTLTPYAALGKMNVNYMLNITRASSKEVAAAYEKLGFGTMGTNIVR